MISAPEGDFDEQHALNSLSDLTLSSTASRIADVKKGSDMFNTNLFETDLVFELED